jgi:gamma-glutamyltranspeptidase / glutathione hydrolase
MRTRRAFADRSTALGEPDFVTAPIAQLLEPTYLARQAASTAADRATPSASIHGMPLHEGTNTTARASPCTTTAVPPASRLAY